MGAATSAEGKAAVSLASEYASKYNLRNTPNSIDLVANIVSHANHLLQHLRWKQI